MDRNLVPLEYYAPSNPWNDTAPGRRANAAFVILCRNTDLTRIIGSIREIEDRFNRRYNYPYVLLNEVEFNDDFKKRVFSTSPSDLADCWQTSLRAYFCEDGVWVNTT